MKAVKYSTVFMLVSFLIYLGYSTYLGLFLGGRPGGWYEGKFLQLAFYPLAMISLFTAGISWMISVVSLLVEFRNDRPVKRIQYFAVGASTVSVAIFILCSYFPLGLGIAYEVAEIRRATWERSAE